MARRSRKISHAILHSGRRVRCSVRWRQALLPASRRQPPVTFLDQAWSQARSRVVLPVLAGLERHLLRHLPEPRGRGLAGAVSRGREQRPLRPHPAGRRTRGPTPTACRSGFRRRRVPKALMQGRARRRLRRPHLRGVPQRAAQLPGQAHPHRRRRRQHVRPDGLRLRAGRCAAGHAEGPGQVRSAGGAPRAPRRRRQGGAAQALRERRRARAPVPHPRPGHAHRLGPGAHGRHRPHRQPRDQRPAGIPENWSTPVAPTKPPFLWNAPQGLWTQWRGVQQVPIERNLIETMGVFMSINLHAKTPAEGLFESNAAIRQSAGGRESARAPRAAEVARGGLRQDRSRQGARRARTCS